MQNKEVGKNYKITQEDLREFTQAQSYNEQLKILIEHSRKNTQRLQIRRIRKMGHDQNKLEQEMLELNNQFMDFLHTKGIKAKFNLALNNMKESTKKQHAVDVENFQQVKAKSAEENKDFVEFLHTKGIKAKFKLVVENIKKGIKEAPLKTKQQIADSKAYAQPVNTSDVTADELAAHFNEFLKSKGLDEKFKVEIVAE